MGAKRFESEKSEKLKMFMILMALGLAVFVYYGPVNVKGISEDNFFILQTIFLLVIYIVGIWSWKGTWYKIEDELLIIKNGFLRYRIPIKSMHKVYLNQKTMHGTTKPTLSMNCILIEYDKHRNISISPLPEDEFLAMLLEVNDKIKIMD